MEQPDILIEKLKQEIIATLGRTIDSPTDFDYLSIKIADKTGDVISVSTLKRLFGYIKGSVTPRPSTLSSLARYVGYSGWSEFCAAQSLLSNELPPYGVTKKRFKIAVLVIGGAVVVGLGFLYFMSAPTSSKVDAVAIEAPQSQTIQPQVEPSDADKYEQILAHCIAESNKMCDAVRARRGGMDKRKYVRLAEDTYNQFVFKELKQMITLKVPETFSGDDALEQRYANDIFIQCREICVTMLREAYL